VGRAVGEAWLSAGALETPGGGSEALAHKCFWASYPFGTNLFEASLPHTTI